MPKIDPEDGCGISTVLLDDAKDCLKWSVWMAVASRIFSVR